MVQAGGDDDVISMTSVDFTESFSQELAKCWDTMVSLLLGGVVHVRAWLE